MGYPPSILVHFFVSIRKKLPGVFQCYFIFQSSINTRRSNKAFDADTFANVLKCFSKSNETNARNIGRKMGYEVARTLLAHGFQVICLVFIEILIDEAIKLD